MISLENMLIISGSIERLLVARNTIIFLHQGFGFVINLKQSVTEPTQTIKYLGLVIGSIRITLSLTEG